MEITMMKKLIVLADYLDKIGSAEAADIIDDLIKKQASVPEYDLLTDKQVELIDRECRLAMRKLEEVRDKFTFDDKEVYDALSDIRSIVVNILHTVIYN